MPHEITILLTGRVDRTVTDAALSSIKTNFPKSNVVISGWIEDQLTIKTLAHKYHLINYILTEDPGSPLRNPSTKRLHNVNRIIVSSQRGLELVKTKYTLRCRADLILKNTDFVRLMHKFSNNQDISKKILVSNITTIDARNGYKILYHVNDWLHFGKTSTVKSFFDIPLMPDNYCNWYESHSKPEDSHDRGNLSRYMAEDWLTYCYIKKFEKVTHEHYWDFNQKELLRWEKILPLYFVVLPNNVLGIYNAKIGKIRDFHLWPFLTLTRYLVLAGFKVSRLQIFFDKVLRIKRLILFKIWKLKERIKEIFTRSTK